MKHIPDGYHSVTPYLVVEDAAVLIDFLKAAFEAEEVVRMADPDGAIKHAEVRIGNSMVMIGQKSPGMPTMLYLYVPDTDAAYHQALKAGAKSLLEPVDQYYGDRNAAVTDSGGNQWWLATRKEDLSPEELERRAAAAT